MQTHFTARKFKARKDVKEHASAELKKLDKYYDGIVRGDVVLSYERTVQSIKKAEIKLYVYGTVLSAMVRSDDFRKSVDLAIGKLERQLTKYKTKFRTKDKKTLRRVKEEVTLPDIEDEE